MRICFAMLASVTVLAAFTATMTRSTADQYPLLADQVFGQAAASTLDQPCGCTHDFDSSTPKPAPRRPEISTNELEAVLKKVQDQLAETDKAKQRVENEKKRIDSDFNATRTELANLQLLRDQKEGQIFDLQRQLAIAYQQHGEKDTQIADLQRLLAAAQQRERQTGVLQRQLAAARRLQGQKDVQIADLRQQQGQKDVQISELQHLLVAVLQVQVQKEAKIDDLKLQLGAKARPQKAPHPNKVSEAKTVYHYGQYEVIPLPGRPIDALRQ
jgi:chromosome segregation ATPase